MKAVIYARFSPRPNADDCDSIEKQLECCRAYCQAFEYEVIAEHQDAAMSGGRADNRPGLQAAMDDACKHKAVLVVYNQSRLSRNTGDALTLIQRLHKKGADLAMLDIHLDTSTPVGEMVFSILASVNTMQRKEIKIKTSRAMLKHQRNGRRMSKQVPYGYREDPRDPALIIEDEHEQDIITRILEADDVGHSAREIMRSLNRQGETARNGKEFYNALISRVLTRHKAQSSHT